MLYVGRGNWIEVDELEIVMYSSDIKWSLRNILYGLGASKDQRCNCILDNYIWDFGKIYLNQYKAPLIIVRCITSEEVYQCLVHYLDNYHAKTSALVIFIERYRIPKYFAYPQNHICIDINDILVNDLGRVHFSIDFILEKMGKEKNQGGFSEGYRSRYFNGISYTFTKKQAEVLELLDKVKKPLHQDEITAIVSPNASYNRISLIFSSKGKLHPAWEIIIKHDSKGYYWIER